MILRRKFLELYHWSDSELLRCFLHPERRVRLLISNQAKVVKQILAQSVLSWVFGITGIDLRINFIYDLLAYLGILFNESAQRIDWVVLLDYLNVVKALLSFSGTAFNDISDWLTAKNQRELFGVELLWPEVVLWLVNNLPKWFYVLKDLLVGCKVFIVIAFGVFNNYVCLFLKVVSVSLQ